MKLHLGKAVLLASALTFIPKAAAITLPPAFDGYVRFTLTHGVRYSPGGTVFGPSFTSTPGFRGTFRLPDFRQSGGMHVVSGSMALEGNVDLCWACSGRPYYARYRLSGGRLICGTVRVTTAVFTQSGGTNKVTRELRLMPGWYTDHDTSYQLTGGRLITSNTVVHLIHRSYSLTGRFHQSGGVHVIHGTLGLYGNLATYSSAYQLSAGKLVVRDIEMRDGAIFSHSGGTITHTGTLILAGGHWRAARGQQQLGVLQLKEGLTNSALYLPASSATTLRFAPSSGSPWDPQARLLVHNWRGATTQVYFGTNPTGLSTEQLSQIRFVNPASFPPGYYPGGLRRTGELVPTDIPLQAPAD